MQEYRQQKPISPKQMFSRLLQQSYKQAQCQSQSQKIKKKKLILTQLIQQYQQSICSQLIKVNQLANLEKLKLQKIQQLTRLKKERQIIENSVHQQLSNVAVTANEHQEKIKLTQQLQEIQCVNTQIKFKLKDLHDYIIKLEMHNQRLTSQKNILAIKHANRMRVDPKQWSLNVEALRKKQELEENSMKVKILEKESENIKNIRRQQQEMYQRNQEKWNEFRKTALKPNFVPSYTRGISNERKIYISKQEDKFESIKQPKKMFKSFRVL